MKEHVWNGIIEKSLKGENANFDKKKFDRFQSLKVSYIDENFKTQIDIFEKHQCKFYVSGLTVSFITSVKIFFPTFPFENVSKSVLQNTVEHIYFEVFRKIAENATTDVA